MVSASKLAANKRWGERNREKLLAYRARWAREKRLKDPSLTEEIRRRRGLPDPSRPCPENCECCGVLRRKARSLDLDHCHVSGQFRGWLCNNCNTAIGKLGDSIDGLMKAVRYLERVGQ
jgi:hypothetical protein